MDCAGDVPSFATTLRFIPTHWYIGMIVFIVALTLLGFLLQSYHPVVADDDDTPELTIRRTNSIKWAFYIFAWISALYMFCFTHSAYRAAIVGSC